MSKWESYCVVKVTWILFYRPVPQNRVLSSWLLLSAETRCRAGGSTRLRPPPAAGQPPWRGSRRLAGIRTSLSGLLVGHGSNVETCQGRAWSAGRELVRAADLAAGLQRSSDRQPREPRPERAGPHPHESIPSDCFRGGWLSADRVAVVPVTFS